MLATVTESLAHKRSMAPSVEVGASLINSRRHLPLLLLVRAIRSSSEISHEQVLICLYLLSHKVTLVGNDSFLAFIFMC